MKFSMNARRQYTIKIWLAIALSFFWILILIMPARSAGVTGQDKPYRTEEFSINTPGELSVRTSGGHITVRGTEKNTVKVEMYAQKRGRFLTPNDDDLSDFDIQIEKQGNKVIASARRHSGSRGLFGSWNNNISISFVVYTPREMSTDLNTSGGHIEAENLEGTETLKTSGGHLEMRKLKGTVDARTSGGHIEIADFEGDMDAHTSGGHIEARNAKGTIELRTSGGHIELDHVAGSIDARTSGGHIDADVDQLGKYLTLRTSGGSVNISIPSGQGVDLELKGNLGVNTRLENFSGNVEDDEISGSLNGGGPKITARTSGGRVNLQFH